MGDTYFVEERSGVIGIGPLTHSPEFYYRRPKTDWSLWTSWIHLIICILAVPLIIWNLYLLIDTILLYSDVTPVVVNGTGSDGTTQLPQVHPLAFLIVLCAVLMNLFAGLFALVTETACFSEKFAKFVYIMAYLSITISIYVLVMNYRLLGLLGLILLLLFMVSFGFGFWRFSLISSIYLNEEGPTWIKPLLFLCLAAIPLLTTGSQCRDAKNPLGCLPNDMFGRHTMYNDFFSFTLVILIAILSFLPFLFGVGHNE